MPWTACDLSAVTFFDAIGVGALIAINYEMRAQGLRLSVRSASPRPAHAPILTLKFPRSLQGCTQPT
jgi:anti-anti-sigma regulatory factor